MSRIKVSVTELVAFARCEHKATLIDRAKAEKPPSSQRERGVVTHAIVERKNRDGRTR